MFRPTLMKTSESKEELERPEEELLVPVRRRESSGGAAVSSIPPNNMLFAIPKKGRLHDKVLKVCSTGQPRCLAHVPNSSACVVLLCA